MGTPLRTTEVHWAYLLPLMLAGTKATCCWLSAVLSQSRCAQTCWLLSAADFTDATVGHTGVSKEERQSQAIHHYGATHTHTQGNTHRMQPRRKGRSDLVLPPPVPPTVSFSLSAGLPRSLRLVQTDWRAWNMQHMYQSQSANTSPAVYHSPG